MTSFSTAWPTSTDYTEGIQSPSSFQSPELAILSPVPNMMGVPTAATGQNAVVFLVTDQQGTRHALRCFTSAPVDGRSRYLALDAHLRQLGGRSTVAGIRWVDEGVLVGGNRWPVVLMPWIEGTRLDTKVEDLVGDGPALTTLANQLLATVHDLQANGVAHGDLQHGNVLVHDNLSVTLVDLDGVWVSSSALAPPAELGHPNYQHPGRTDAAWGPNIDSFSALLVDVSLRALAADPSLADLMGGENLVFVRADLEQRQGPVWDRLAASGDEYVRWGALRLQQLLNSRIEASLVTLQQLMAAEQVTTEAPAPANEQATAAAPVNPGDAWWEYESVGAPSEAATVRQTTPPPNPRQSSASVGNGSGAGGQDRQPVGSGNALLSGPVVAGAAGAAAGLLGCVVFGLVRRPLRPEFEAAVFLVLVAGLVGAVVLGWHGLVGGRLSRAFKQAGIGFLLAGVASLVVLPVADFLVTGAINDERAAEAALEGGVATDYDNVDVPILELTASWMLLAALVGLILGVRLSGRAALFGGVAGAGAGLVGGLIHASTGAKVLEDRLLVEPFKPTTLVATAVVTMLIASAVTAARRSGALGVLRVMEGRLAGAEVLLRRDNTIGSASGSTLVLEGRDLLAKHAGLRVQGDEATLTAFGDVQINGQPVAGNAGVGYPLRSGDVLRVGASYVRFTSRAGG